MSEKKQYGFDELIAGNLCPRCQGQVMCVWTSKGKVFECSNCKNELSEVLYPPSKPPEEEKDGES